MKNWIAVLAVLVSTGPVTMSDIMGTGNGPVYWAVFGPLSETINFSTATMAALPVAVSTGPMVMKSFLSADCYKIDKINPNGTIATYPLTWAGCPK